MNIKEWWMPDAQQQAFRTVLDAYARPGTQVTVGDAEADATLALLAALLDESVTLADTTGRLDKDQRRLLLAPDAPPSQAHFVLLDGATAPAAEFKPSLGTLEAPEFGATLLLCVQDLLEQPKPGSMTLRLRGPGIADECELHVLGLHADWIARRAQWVSAFPLGVDLVLCAPRRLAALPRTTRIELQRN
jgi:alpha-D-ribose 1-methylphosphonate 5-triphosphate synthase subunit PhnH